MNVSEKLQMQFFLFSKNKHVQVIIYLAKESTFTDLADKSVLRTQKVSPPRFLGLVWLGVKFYPTH